MTGNSLYRDRVVNIRQVLKDIEKPNGLYPNYLNPKTGKWGQREYSIESIPSSWMIWLNQISIFAEHISLGALGDSFYEYLLKAWIQNGQTESDVRQMYDDAMQALIKNIIVTSPSGLTYASDMKFDRLEHKMDHLACFAGNATITF